MPISKPKERTVPVNWAKPSAMSGVLSPREVLAPPRIPTMKITSIRRPVVPSARAPSTGRQALLSR